MNEQINRKRQYEHHAFIELTDRKHLHNQIGTFVLKATEIANEELEQRQEKLKKLIENDDKILEEEFANKVYLNSDENIRKRREALLKNSEEEKKKTKVFVEKRRHLQHMTNCHEFRSVVSNKMAKQVQECQLEQMLEKERTMARERQMDKYWVNVQQLELECQDKRKNKEESLKVHKALQINKIRDKQIVEQAQKRNEQQEYRAYEALQIKKLLKELHTEKINRHQVPAEVVVYRQELLNQIAQKKNKQMAQAEADIRQHRQMSTELARIKDSESAAADAQKRALHVATLDYIKYVKDVRRLKENQQKMYDQRADDLSRVEQCTKNNIAKEMKRKAEIAAECHAAVKRQICEKYERQIREQFEKRECSIIENPFASQQSSSAEIRAQKLKHRADLEKQIAELNRTRAMEEAEYRKDLQLAQDDSNVCAKLAEQYIQEDFDYLEPHANWRILVCPKQDTKLKPKKDMQDVPTERPINCDSCIIPCGSKPKRGKGSSLCL